VTHHALARFAPAVVLACALAGTATAQNVGSYGMATKPPPPTPETLGKLDISEGTQQRIVYGVQPLPFGSVIGGPGVVGVWEKRIELGATLGTTPPLDGTWYDHTGTAVTLREVIGGKPTVLVPIYIRCPRLCGETIENLMTCLRQMREKDREMTPGKAFNLVFFSIDDHEHPLIAAPRRELFHKDLDGRSADEPGVWFLAANPGQFSDPAVADRTIREVTDAIGYHFVKADRKGREIQHPTAVLVLTPTGRVSSYNTAISFDANELIGQVKTAADGKPGTTSALASLACFLGTDPTGMYRVAMRILGWSSVPVLLAVCGVVFLGWRRSRQDAKLTPPIDRA
jgi:protein SCO1